MELTSVYWELAASLATLIFVVSTYQQLAKIRATNCTTGLSQSQWVGYVAGNIIFIGFDIHIGAYIMAVVSFVGTVFSAHILYLVHRGG